MPAIREQFHVPIGRFEAVQERLGRMAATAYLLDAARRLTCAAIDRGHKPAVITAIMKAQATERMRVSANDAMDVHGGKGVMEGPLNYLGNLYRAVPIGITVEGANIVTRSLIQFGQGAIRSHPFILKEMLALEESDRGARPRRVRSRLLGPCGPQLHQCAARLRPRLDARLCGAGAAGGSRHRLLPAAQPLLVPAFALLVDLALLTLGGNLKRREMISARFGDVLSELYLLSAVLKRWNEEGRQPADLPLVQWCMAQGFATIEMRLDEIIANFPEPPGRVADAVPAAAVRHPHARAVRRPHAGLRRHPAGAVGCARPAHRRHLSPPADDSGVARLEHAFALIRAVRPLRDRLRQAHVHDIAAARARGLITDAEADQLKAVQLAIAAVVAVDDFPAEELSPRRAARAQGDVSSPTATPFQSNAAE